jgi:signal transduction histidine kinase
MKRWLFKSSITKRLFVEITAIVLLFAMLVLLTNTLLLKPMYIYNLKKDMAEAMKQLETIDFSNAPVNWIQDIHEIDSGRSYDIVIIFGNAVMYSSSSEVGSSYERREYELYSLFLIQWIDNWEKQDGGLYSGTAIEPQTNTEMLVYAKRISNQLTIYLTQPIEPMNESVRQFNLLLGLLTVIFLSFTVFIVLRLSRRFTQPIRQIQQSVEEIVNLNFNAECQVKTGDELENLSDHVNHLSRELQKSLVTLQQQNEQLEKDVLLQRKFLSNASHELRTPLSLIKGYADEIDAGFVLDQRQQVMYVGIIAEEAKKMNRLLKEMLDLSRMESGTMTFQNQTVSVNDQIRAFIEKYDGFIRENQLTIKMALCEHDIGYFDPMRFEQILANYLSNAAKYGDEKKQLLVSSQRQNDNIRVAVFNTGKHLTEPVMAQIWNGFFKSDDARTRVEGSYGLGLSIVKAIQQVAGQAYGVNNVPNGVEFWFNIAVSKSKT